MRMDCKAALLAVGMMVGVTAIAGAQEADYFSKNVSYTSTIADGAACGCDATADCGVASCDTGCAPSCGCESACGCNTCFSDCCGCGLLSGLPCCPHGDAWTLFPENDCGVTIGGWVSGGYYGNFRGINSNTGNAPLGFNGNAQNVLLNQVWLYAEKEADAETYCFDLGYRVDAMFGADGPDTQAFGHGNRHVWDNRWDSGSDYGGAIPQLYMTAAWSDWSVKVGHFYTLIGWEVVAAPDNFFYSHAYTMYYGEPFTHWGALAEYNGIEGATIYGGWTSGWDTAFDTFEAGNSFLGGISASLTDNMTMYWMITAGDFGKNASGASDSFYMNSFVLEADLGCGLTYIFQTDMGIEFDVAAGQDNNWYGVNQYLTKEINDCWSVGARLEWFADEDGSRVVDFNGNNVGSGNYYAATLGLNWKPNANFTLRPEIRFDKFDDRWGSGATPFGDNTNDDMVLYGMDAIFTF